jgi:hypothetical protein
MRVFTPTSDPGVATVTWFPVAWLRYFGRSHVDPDAMFEPNALAIRGSVQHRHPTDRPDGQGRVP